MYELLRSDPFMMQFQSVDDEMRAQGLAAVFDHWVDLWSDVVEIHDALPPAMREALEAQPADLVQARNVLRSAFVTVHPDVARGIRDGMVDKAATARQVAASAMDPDERIAELERQVACKARVIRALQAFIAELD